MSRSKNSRREFRAAIRRGDSSGALRAAKLAGCGVLILGGRFVLQRLTEANDMGFNDEKSVYEYEKGFASSGNRGKTSEGKEFIVVTYEIADGVRKGQRYDFRGYINSRPNAERTIKALRLSGWKGKSWAEINVGSAWDSKPVSLALSREWTMSGDRQYLRIAFVNAIRRAEVKTPLSDSETAELDRRFENLLALDSEDLGDEEPSGPYPNGEHDPATGEVRA